MSSTRNFVRVFLLLLALPAPLDLLLYALDVDLPGMAFVRRRPALTTAGLVNGEAGAALESAIADQSVIAHGTGPFLNEAWFRAIGRVPARVRVREDLVFVEERVRPESRRFWAAAAERAVARVVEAAAPFRAAGVPLRVVLVPDRSRALREIAFGEEGVPAGRDGFLDAVKRGLEGAGVDVLVLDAALREAAASGPPVFYRGDHHWTFRGAEAAAGATARALAARGPDGLPRCAHAPFRATWAPEPRPPRSLARMLGFRADGALGRRFVGEAERARLEPVADAACGPGRVAVLTTSYGQFGFAAFLSAAARVPVEEWRGVGKRAFWAPAALVATTLAGQAPALPDAVVWEIPEYHLYAMPPDVPSFLEHRTPVWRPGPGWPLGWRIVASDGVRRQEESALRTTARRARVVLALDAPARAVRVRLAASAVPGRGRLGCEGDPRPPLLLADGRGDAVYDFAFDAPRDELALTLDLRGVGHTVRIRGVRALDR